MKRAQLFVIKEKFVLFLEADLIIKTKHKVTFFVVIFENRRIIMIWVFMNPYRTTIGK